MYLQLNKVCRYKAVEKKLLFIEGHPGSFMPSFGIFLSWYFKVIAL